MKKTLLAAMLVLSLTSMARAWDCNTECVGQCQRCSFGICYGEPLCISGCTAWKAASCVAHAIGSASSTFCAVCTYKTKFGQTYSEKHEFKSLTLVNATAQEKALYCWQSKDDAQLVSDVVHNGSCSSYSARIKRLIRR